MKYFGEIFALVADLLHRCPCLPVMTLMWEQEIDLVFAQTAAEIASAERTHTHTHKTHALSVASLLCTMHVRVYVCRPVVCGLAVQNLSMSPNSSWISPKEYS